MKLDPKFEPPNAPHLVMNDLLAEEQEIGRSISLNLRSLSSEGKNIAAAIALFEVCRANDAQDLFGDWMRVSARDGAMSIRNFGEALARVRSLIGSVKSWLPLIDTQALKSAEAIFTEKFPFAHKMRHSVAHPELYNDPKKKMGVGNMYDLGIKVENSQDVVIREAINGYTFGSTFDGIFIKYDLNDETIDIILRIIYKAYDAFSPPDLRGMRRFPPLQ